MTKKSDKQSRFFAIVLEGKNKRNNEEITSERVRNVLGVYARDFGVSYWAILHDRDTDALGDIERPHYHIVLEFPTRHVKSAILKQFSFLADVPPEMVSIETCYLIPSIRYLTHMDYPGFKTMYSVDDVFTNDHAKLESACRDQEEITLKKLVQVIDNAQSYREILVAIGPALYRQNHSIIVDLFKEKMLYAFPKEDRN